MKKIEIKGQDQFLYYEKLKNGLEVYFVPYENKSNYCMYYVTKFGSIQTEFIPIGKNKMKRVPDGIAHFLEHKMFEQKEGMTPFAFASKTGTYSNALTNYELTCYYFEGNKGFNKNLNYLIDFVNKPYFTDENVLKEKGIIAEEIKQYDDNVDWFIDEEIKKALLTNDNHRVDIAGTIESINKITKEDLYDTYNTFYQPSNMFIVITGKFDIEKAIKVIKNNKSLNSKKTNYEIKVKEIKEDLCVNKKCVNKKFNVANTRVAYGIKIPIIGDLFTFNNYIALMLRNKFGVSSLFRESLKKENLITNFFYEKEIVGDYLLILFKASSEEPEKLVNKIKNELKNIEISEEDIKRTIKVWISSKVMMVDNISLAVENIIDDVILTGKVIPNKIDLYRKLNKKKYMEILNKIDFTNSSLLIVKSNKN